MSEAWFVRESATYLAWQSHFAVGLQISRLREASGLGRGHGQLLADATALVIDLWRLRLAAEASEALPGETASIRAARERFDAALPGLKRLRDVTMHVNNYALENDLRRNTVGKPPRRVEARDLWELKHVDGGFTWLDVTVNYEAAQTAARFLYDAIQDANNSQLEPRRWGPRAT